MALKKKKTGKEQSKINGRSSNSAHVTLIYFSEYAIVIITIYDNI